MTGDSTVGTIAGIANVVGEAMQGHWTEVGIAAGTAVLATVGLGILGRAAKGLRHEVGLAKDLRKASSAFTEVHHVPQTAHARSLIGDYNLANHAGNEVGIRISNSEHAAVNAAQRARTRTPASAREALADEIRILRNETSAPNSALQKAIKMNKELHPYDFEK